jgi:hypothetical protein
MCRKENDWPNLDLLILCIIGLLNRQNDNDGGSVIDFVTRKYQRFFGYFTCSADYRENDIIILIDKLVWLTAPSTLVR